MKEIKCYSGRVWELFGKHKRKHNLKVIVEEDVSGNLAIAIKELFGSSNWQLNKEELKQCIRILEKVEKEHKELNK